MFSIKLKLVAFRLKWLTDCKSKDEAKYNNSKQQLEFKRNFIDYIALQ